MWGRLMTWQLLAAAISDPAAIDDAVAIGGDAVEISKVAAIDDV